jgi:hypothetical protein
VRPYFKEFLCVTGWTHGNRPLTPAVVDFAVGAVKIAMQVAPLLVRQAAIARPVGRPKIALRLRLKLRLPLWLGLALVAARPLLQLHVHPAAYAAPWPGSRRQRCQTRQYENRARQYFHVPVLQENHVSDPDLDDAQYYAAGVSSLLVGPGFL